MVTVLVRLAMAFVVVTVAAGCTSEASAPPASVRTTSATPIASTTGIPSTTTAATTTSPPPVATTAAPSQGATVAELPADVRAQMTGRSWRPGCPVGLDDLRLVEVPFVDLSGATRRGRLVIHADHAASLARVFEQLYAQRFSIERMDLIDELDGDDDASMAANNTSAFNCRPVDGTNRWSEHAYGRAVDVNPRFNPWVRGARVDPPNGATYVDRSKVRSGMIVAGDAVVRAFAAEGWSWGGDQRQAKDYQHFSTTGR